MAGEGGADIPGMGHLSKKELTIGATLLLLVIGVAWYRHHKNAASASASASTPATDTGVGIDPATGFTSGSPEDLAALQAQAGSAGSGGGGGGGYGGYTGTTAPSPAGGITDNPTWSQDVENYLVNTLGNPNDPLWALTVGNALGKYLTGQAMTSDQVNIVEQGIAFYGLPPQAGNNGYPPNYRTGPILNGGLPPVGQQGNKNVPDGYYRDASEGGAIYHVSGNKVWHVTAQTWVRLNPKPAVREVGPGWLGRVGIPYVGEE